MIRMLLGLQPAPGLSHRLNEDDKENDVNEDNFWIRNENIAIRFLAHSKAFDEGSNQQWKGGARRTTFSEVGK